MRAEVVQSIGDLSRREWNRLGGEAYPFLRHEFLYAAEHTGCTAPARGWTPRHVALFDDAGRLAAAMPLFEKTHSWGEFVFDWSWAHAYERVGLEYYPKLVSSAPFTPAPSGRLLTGGDPDLGRELIAAALDLAADYSSLHVLFPHPGELGLLQSAGLMVRKDCQFHWHNRGYTSFDDFLATFSSAKRKKVRRDRRCVADQRIRFRWLAGRDLDRAMWGDVYELISMTFLRRGSLPYFSFDFFVDVSRLLPDSILVVLAERDATPIAAAVFYVGEDSLYGRYWGSDARYNALHFETCYYQGIDYCIANNKKLFEPGTQGEHKISRGFEPVSTWSAHWLARPEFYAAVADFLDEEERHVDRYIDAVNAHSPYRKDDRIDSR